MTDLGADLRKLHAAGRIRSPWLPGMRVHGTAPASPIGTVTGYASRRAGGLDVSWDGGTIDREAVASALTPDTSWPATLGCLLALLREAAGDPTAEVSWVRHSDVDLPRWFARCEDPASGACTRWLAGPCETEAAAIAAALHALAEECR